MLKINDIHTYYGDSYVLQGISLGVRKGTVVGILGRNGVGKTTLIRSIIGFSPVRRGQILFKDVDITHLPPYKIARMQMGLVPQGRRIFPSLTVQENLTLAARDAGASQWDQEKIFGRPGSRRLFNFWWHRHLALTQQPRSPNNDALAVYVRPCPSTG